MSCPKYGPCDDPGNCKSCAHNHRYMKSSEEVRDKSRRRVVRKRENQISELEMEEVNLHTQIDELAPQGKPYFHLEDRIIEIRRKILNLKAKIKQYNQGENNG